MPFQGFRSLYCGFTVYLFFASEIYCEDVIDFQKSLPVKEVWAVVGKKAELPCDISPQRPKDKISMVLWFKDVEGIPLYSMDARDGGIGNAHHWAIDSDMEARTFFLANENPSRLIVTNVLPEDQGVYRCRVDFLNAPTRNFKVNLTVVVPPESPVIIDAHGEEVATVAGPFLQGYDLLLTCHVRGGFPRPEVTWWLGRALKDSISETSNDKMTVNQLFLPNVSRNMLGSKLACVGSNSNLTSPVVKEISLDLYLRPLKTTILTEDDMMSADHTRTLKCESSGSVPAAKIVWLLDGEPIRHAESTTYQEENATVSELTFHPSSTDHGRVLTCRAENPWFPGGIEEDRLRLNVAFKPSSKIRLGTGMDADKIKEGGNIYLQCDVQANPHPQFIKWYHKGIQLVHNDSAGVLMGEKSLVVKSITRESDGEYSCGALNSQGEDTSDSLFIRVQFSPRCREGVTSTQVGALRHETLKVRCEVEADPPVVKFRWTYNKTRDVLPIPGFRVTSHGLVSQLDYTPASEMDYGTLACWAENEVGQQKKPCQFHLMPARPPQTPEGCMIQNKSLGGLEVDCRPGFDGGLPQHFVLEVTESTVPLAQPVGVKETKNPLHRVLSAEPSFTLHSLEPGRDYDMTIYSVNAKGKSESVVLTQVRISAMEMLTSRDSSDHQPLAIVLGVLIAAAALILGGVFAVAALVICRRRTEPPKSPQAQEVGVNEDAVPLAPSATPTTDTTIVTAKDCDDVIAPLSGSNSNNLTPQPLEDAGSDPEVIMRQRSARREADGEPTIRISRVEVRLSLPKRNSDEVSRITPDTSRPQS